MKRIPITWTYESKVWKDKQLKILYEKVAKVYHSMKKLRINVVWFDPNSKKGRWLLCGTKRSHQELEAAESE